MGNLSKRYGLDQAPPDPKLKGAAVMPASALKPSPAVPVAEGKAERIEAARRVVKEAGNQARVAKILDVAKIPVAKIKPDVAKIDGAANYATRRGRPRRIEGEPWVAEGVTRRTWERRQKGER